MLLTFLFSLPNRVLHSLRGSWMWLAMVLLSCSLTAHAQFVTKNAYVEADVSADGQGLVSLFYANTSHLQGIIHPSQTSYLTILVNGTSYYTNNQHLPLNGPPPAPPPYPAFPAGYLENGKTSYTGPNKDTIETIWEPQGPNTYKVIQDIYPVAFPIEGSGQVVFRFSIVNLQNKPLSVQPQYLLDVELSQGDSVNDVAPITTRYGYLSTQWTAYPPTNSVPPYFIATLEPLSYEHFPYMLAEGYCNDSLAPEPMGLVEASLLAYTDWREVATNWTWGYPTSPSLYPTIGDEALLFQWPGSGADSGQTMVIGSFSYGSAACAPICLGNVDAMMVHPDHIVWNGSSYSPNPFPVDGIVWNANQVTASTASGTQSIAPTFPGVNPGPVKVLSPLPTTKNGYAQTHNLSNAATIPGQESSSISWEDTVLADILVNCSTDSSYDIGFSVQAGGVGATACQNGTYTCPIIVDCEQKDLTPPRHTVHVGVGSLNSCGHYSTFVDSVYDNLLSDQGVNTITWVVVPANAAKVTVANFTTCDHTDSVRASVTQVDTLLSSCVYFTYTDCAGNSSLDTQCFDVCLPPGIIDTLPPRFRLLNRSSQNFTDTTNSACEFQCSQWVVTDSVVDGLQHDGGLASVFVVGSTNLSFNLVHPVKLGMKEDTFTVCVIDSMQDGSIVIGATDSIGHGPIYDTITYCTVPDMTPPDVQVTGLQSGWLVTVSETKPWDRGIDSISLTTVENCAPVVNPSIKNPVQIDSVTWYILPADSCSDSLYFVVNIIDTFKNAGFTEQAWDCAGNANTKAPYFTQALTDNFCPTDTLTQISPTEIRVIFSDYHVQDNYDVGLDSIWITNVNNMSMLHGNVTTPLTVGTVIHEPDNGTPPAIYPILDTVFFFVTDTSLHSTIPDSVCWDAVDGSMANNGGGNFLCSSVECWDVSLAQDTTPPIVNVTYDPCDSLAVTVTDMRPLDQGIYKVWLDTSAQTVNIQPFSETEPQPGVGSLSFSLPILDRNKSASGHLSAFDVYGDESKDSTDQAIHTTSLNLAVYRQDLAMIASGIVNTTSNSGVTFNVPVYLTPTDTFSLARKNITQFQFQFHISGSPLLTFVGTKIPPTMPAGWTIAPLPGTGTGAGPSYTITGQGPALTNLNMTDTLVYLVFSGAKSTDIEEAQIVPDADNCTDNVSYNNGNDTLYSTANYSVTLPAPAGLINGGTVVFMDSCATIVGNNPHPTILSIAPAIPNPFTSSTLVQYTVPAEAPVKLELYDALGQKMQTLVTNVQKQGTYQMMMDGSSLRGGTYFLRLESGGQICSQRIILSH
jgi:hypothetical protein